MRAFRITQTQPLTQVLPFKIEEYRRVWYLPWPVWRSLKERSRDYDGSRLVVRRFQTAAEARLCIEQIRARQKARQRQLAAEGYQRQQLPRIVEQLPLPVAG